MSKKLFIIIIMLVLMFNQLFSLTIKRVVRVEKEKVFLSDIFNDLDEKIKKKADEIQLSFSPKPGNEKVIKGSYIKIKIKQLENEELDNLDIPEEVIVVREYQLFYKKNIIKDIKSELLKNDDKDLEIKVNINEDEKLKLPIGDLELKIDNTEKINSSNSKGNITTYVYIDGELYDKFNIRVELVKVVKVYILNRDVNRGDFFAETDVELVKKSEKDIRIKNYLSGNLKKYVGMIYSRNIKKDKVLSDKNFEKQKMFKRNDTVLLYINKGNLIIKGSGKALEDGYVGEEAKVLIPKSKKTVIGLVSENGNLEVEFE